MSHNVQVLGDLELAGSLQFGKNLSDFPVVGKPREMVIKNGVPYIYTELVDGSGFFSWQPIGIKQASHLHTQGVASTVWTVTHNFNSTDFAYFVYDQNHHLVLANITMIDDNTAQINLTQAMTGTAVLFSLQYINSTTVAASSQLNLGTSSLTTSAGVLNVNGNAVAFNDYVDAQDNALSARIDNLASNIDPAAIDSLSEVVTAFQNADGDLTTAIGALSTSAASALSTEVARAQNAEAALTTTVNTKADEADLLTEIDDRAAADTALQGNIDSEASARAAADTTLQSHIDAEASARTAADSALQTNIDGKANTSHAHSIADVVVDGSIIPTADVTYDLGSASKRFKDLYLSGNSIHLGGAVLSANVDGSIALPAGSKVGDVHIPTAVSGLTNDLGFQTAAQVTAAITSAAPSLTGSTTVDFSAKKLTVAGDILPAVSGVSNIGSPTDKFAAIYTKEMHIDANTLYVDGVPVLGSSANTIQFTADTNQGMRISTTGSGVLTLESQSTTTLKSNGQNADVLVQSSGQGSMSRVTSDTQIVLTAPTVNVQGSQSVSGDLVVTGNLTTHGSVVTVDSTNLAIKDNVITVNKGETGSGVSVRYAGIDVDRGDLARQRMVWDETVGKWKMGATGAEANIASEDYVGTAIAGKANSSSLATVATSGSYADLSNKPTIPTVPAAVSAFTNDSGYQTSAQVSSAITTAIAGKANTSSLATVATSGSYNDLLNKPTIPTVPTAVSAFTNDSGYQTAANVTTAIANKADKATSLSGYGITDAYTKTAVDTALSAKANTASLATVATSGSYTDLTNKPTIPTVPTAVSAFTNDSGFQTATQVNTAIQAVVGAAPVALDTLQEIAAQLATDESAVSALTTTVSNKAPLTHVGSTGTAHGNATTTVAGFMSSTDKTKLDAISGTNTGDETATTIKTKLGITTLSGSNTGDQTIALTGDVTGSGTGSFAATLATITDSGTGTFKKVTVNDKGLVTGTVAVAQADITGLLGAGSITNTMLANGAVANLSGTNTGDETAATIKTKLAITTLSGSNTGDQTITLTGDATGTGTGSFAVTLTNSGVTAGTYNAGGTQYQSFTVDAKGRVTAVGVATTITPAFSSITSKPTTLSGYGITDAQASNANLTSVAGLPTASTGLMKMTNGVASLDTSAYQTAAQVTASIQAVVGAAPAALDTLQEIAAQLATDESAVSALTTTVSGKVTANAAITAGSAVKVSYDAKGLVTGVATLTKADLAAVLSGLTWADFA